MNEEVIFYAIIGTNVLMYILAFALAFFNKQDMTFYVILLVIESLIVLFCVFACFSDGDPMGVGYLLSWLAISLIVFTLVLVITIFVKMPSWHTVVYILITIGFSWAIFFVVNAIMDKQSAKRHEDYYKNNYIMVYEVEVDKKFILMLKKSELETNEFNIWIICEENDKNFGYNISWGGEKVREILIYNEYKVLNEEIHAKIQEKWGDKNKIDEK